MWGSEAKLAALAIKARFVGGEKCPHSGGQIRWWDDLRAQWAENINVEGDFYGPFF